MLPLQRGVKPQRYCVYGLVADFDAILFDLKLRDERDSGRSAAPLKQALDAHLLNTDQLSIAEAVQQVMRWYKTTG